MFVPLDFLNAVVYLSISKPIEEVWDNIVAYDVEKAKDKGIQGIYELARSEMFNTDKYGDYKCLEIDQKILDKLLKGEIKTIEEISTFQQAEIENNYTESAYYIVFYNTQFDEDRKENLTLIDSIFIN